MNNVSSDVIVLVEISNQQGTVEGENNYYIVTINLKNNYLNWKIVLHSYWNC